MKKQFENMNISKNIKKAVKEMGFEIPTEIQEKAIPKILEGKDIIGQAQTGTGKTAAFAIPNLERIDTTSQAIQSIILCPTRELAIQVTKEYKKLGKHIDNLRVLPVYGGQSIGKQLRELKKGVQVVVGTPGRVMDHMRRGTLKLDNIKMVILDEADEMLNMGFRDDIEFVLKQTPNNRQTLLFSATMPHAIKKIARNYQKNSEIIKVNQKSLTVEKIDQYYLRLSNRKKYEALVKFLKVEEHKLALIFSNTKRMTDELATKLRADGFLADGLHGDMSQSQRDSVMGRFRDGYIEVLVATDVAARGLDVDNVELVFNYDVPQDSEYYIHRIGRTGRAGRAGKAITFDSGRNKKTVRKIRKFNPKNINIPSDREIVEAQEQEIIEGLKDSLTQEKLSSETKIIEKLMKETNMSAVEIAASLLNNSMNQKAQKNQKEDLMRKQFENSGGEPGMVRLFVNIGKSKKVQPRDFVGAIAGESKIPGKVIGAIDILNNFSFVEVPMEYGKKVLSAMDNNSIKGYDVNMEVANIR